jgi:hypothetical protein
MPNQACYPPGFFSSLLRKKTFRGIKRPTIIFVLENRAGSEDDEVAMTTLSMGCYDLESDTIDFTKADRSTVKRSLISQSAYVPENVTRAPWMADIAEEESAAILTKVSSGDARILSRMAESPRLGSILKLAYKKRTRNSGPSVDRIPEGDSPALYETYTLMGYGLKLGGRAAMDSSGLPIYKGQNVFPSRIIGEPMGYWNSETSHVDSLLLYTHFHLLEERNLYAIREISQLPVACPVPVGCVFQNTVLLAQLTEDFPLNLYLVSRIPQWFAMKVLRASIIEDLHTHWYKRGLVLLPIPARRSPEDIASVVRQK